MISGRDSGTAEALYLNLFDSKQMEKQGRETRGEAALNLNYSKIKITGVEEETKERELHQLMHSSLQPNFHIGTQ